MFFEFPHSKLAYEDIARNIMLGQALKFSPNIHAYNKDVTQEDFFFPAGYWCNIFDFSCIHQVADGN